MCRGERLVNRGSAGWLAVQFGSPVSVPVFYLHASCQSPRAEFTSGLGGCLLPAPSPVAWRPSVLWGRVRTVSLGLPVGTSWGIGAHHFEILS